MKLKATHTSGYCKYAKHNGEWYFTANGLPWRKAIHAPTKWFDENLMRIKDDKEAK